MSWTQSNPVSIGAATKKSHYDALWDNTQFRKDTSNGDFSQIIVGTDGSATAPFLKRNGDQTGIFFDTNFVGISVDPTDPTSGEEVTRFNISGIGIGNTDVEDWNSGSFRAVEFLGGGALFGHDAAASGELFGISENAYNDGSWKYKYAGEAAKHHMKDGVHVLSVSNASGSADGAITWLDSFTILNDGSVGVGDVDINNMAGTLTIHAGGSNIGTIAIDTADGSDSKSLRIGGGGDAADNRGSVIELFGNEGGADIILKAGNVAGGGIHFWGSGSSKASMEDDGGFVIGSPTGGGKGTGSINAQAVYDDNVLLTDHVFEKYYKRTIIDKRFKNYKMKTLNQQAKFVKKNYHLSTITGRKEWEKKGKKSLGMIVTQLWETIETQFLYITELNGRITKLENG